MKTLLSVTGEISVLRQYVADNTPKKGAASPQVKKKLKELEFLKAVQFYLQSNPSQQFIEAEVKRISERIESVNSRFDYWCKCIAPKNVDPKEYRAMFNKEMGVTAFRKQLTTLEFILND